MNCIKVSSLSLLIFLCATINTGICGVINKIQYEVDADCLNGLPNYRYYPYDCSKYYGCENGTLHTFTCGDGLFWNDAIEACDLHEKTDCSHIIPYPDPDCSNGQSEYFEYPYDCSKFWECFNSSVYLFTCPSRTMWNDKIKECDEHNNVECSPIPYPDSPTEAPTTITAIPTTTTTESPTTTSEIVWTYTTPKIECTYDNTYYPYPFDCKKYYECSNGVPELMECPGELVWNDDLKTCDFINNVDCSRVISTPYPLTTESYKWIH